MSGRGGGGPAFGGRGGQKTSLGPRDGRWVAQLPVADTDKILLHSVVPICTLPPLSARPWATDQPVDASSAGETPALGPPPGRSRAPVRTPSCIGLSETHQLAVQGRGPRRGARRGPGQRRWRPRPVQQWQLLRWPERQQCCSGGGGAGGRWHGGQPQGAGQWLLRLGTPRRPAHIRFVRRTWLDGSGDPNGGESIQFTLSGWPESWDLVRRWMRAS